LRGPIKFHNRIALITGASGDIGWATAKALINRGCHLVLASRDITKLHKLEKELEQYRNGVICVQTDITNPGSVKEMVTTALQHFARIDYLICCAGQFSPCSENPGQEDSIQRLIETNFFGTLNCVFEVLPHKVERRSGHIIIVSAIDGKRGTPPDAAFAASKSAIAAYLEVIRQEYRSMGICFSTVFPGRLTTSPMTQTWQWRLFRRISPDKAARGIVQAITKKKREVIIPAFGLRLLMLVNFMSPALGDWLLKPRTSRESKPVLIRK
jgi:short-subunit dehydrogenase